MSPSHDDEVHKQWGELLGPNSLPNNFPARADCVAAMLFTVSYAERGCRPLSQSELQALQEAASTIAPDLVAQLGNGAVHENSAPKLTVNIVTGVWETDRRMQVLLILRDEQGDFVLPYPSVRGEPSKWLLSKDQFAGLRLTIERDELLDQLMITGIERSFSPDAFRKQLEELLLRRSGLFAADIEAFIAQHGDNIEFPSYFVAHQSDPAKVSVLCNLGLRGFSTLEIAYLPDALTAVCRTTGEFLTDARFPAEVVTDNGSKAAISECSAALLAGGGTAVDLDSKDQLRKILGEFALADIRQHFGVKGDAELVGTDPLRTEPLSVTVESASLDGNGNMVCIVTILDSEGATVAYGSADRPYRKAGGVVGYVLKLRGHAAQDTSPLAVAKEILRRYVRIPYTAPTRESGELIATIWTPQALVGELQMLALDPGQSAFGGPLEAKIHEHLQDTTVIPRSNSSDSARVGLKQVTVGEPQMGRKTIVVPLLCRHETGIHLCHIFYSKRTGLIGTAGISAKGFFVNGNWS